MNAVQLEVYGGSDRGRRRKDNQDTIFWAGATDARLSEAQIGTNGYLVAVADGVGGIAGGREASQLLVGELADAYYSQVQGDIPYHLSRAIADANRAAYARNDYPNASTTLVAAVVHEDKLVIANVGDSRAYLIRGGRITQLTHDHVYGKRLLRYLVAIEDADPDIFPPIELLSDDRVLLCSDGLYRMLEADEIAAIVACEPAELAVRTLIERANQNGGRDNISAIVVRVLPQPPVPFHHLLPRWETITPICL